MTMWWAVALVVVGLVGAFTAFGGRWTLNGILVLLLLGLPIALVWPTPYRFLGDWSPLAFAALSGNLDAYLTALCVVVWLATRLGRPRMAGSAAGLAAALKLSPFALVLWFVVRRHYTALKAFVVTVAVLTVVGVIGAGLGANLAFTHLLLGAGVSPTPLSIAGMLETWLVSRDDAGSYLLLSRRARWAFRPAPGGAGPRSVGRRCAIAKHLSDCWGPEPLPAGTLGRIQEGAAKRGRSS